MTNLIGQVEAFQPGIDDREQYTERLEQYFVANKVVDEVQQLAVFITIVGSKTYALLSDLLAPVKPADKSYKELKDVLKAHLKLKPLIIAERFRFHQRSQQTGGSTSAHSRLTTIMNILKIPTAAMNTLNRLTAELISKTAYARRGIVFT